MLATNAIPRRYRACMTDPKAVLSCGGRQKRHLVDGKMFLWRPRCRMSVCSALRFCAYGRASIIADGPLVGFVAGRARAVIRAGLVYGYEDASLILLEDATATACHRSRFVARANSEVYLEGAASGILLDEATAIIRDGARGQLIVRSDKATVADLRSAAEIREWPVVRRV